MRQVGHLPEEGVTVCVSRHTFSLKFLIENQFSTAEVETFDWLRNPLDAKVLAQGHSLLPGGSIF